MSVVRRHIATGAVSPRKLHPSLLQYKHVYEKFNYQPILTKATGFGDPTGATGDTNLAQFRRMNALYHVKGAGQTILGPSWPSGSSALLNVAQDEVAAEGAEYAFGGLITSPAPLNYTVGSTAPVEARLKLAMELLSGAGGELAFGLREAEAFTANLDDYTDLACLNIQNGVVNLETILNNAATVTTDTLKDVAAGGTVELKVRITGRTPRFFVNGQETITASTPYVFTAGLVLVPFFFLLHGATPGDIQWDEFEFAYVEDIDDTRVSGAASGN